MRYLYIELLWYYLAFSPPPPRWHSRCRGYFVSSIPREILHFSHRPLLTKLTNQFFTTIPPDKFILGIDHERTVGTE